MIEIQGLTVMQLQLCGALWACDTIEEVEVFIECLPFELQSEARMLQQLIIAAVLDHDISTEDDCEEAREILSKLFTGR